VFVSLFERRRIEIRSIEFISGGRVAPILLRVTGVIE